MSTPASTLRVTRGRTGKLPTPKTRKGFVADFDEEEGSPSPSPSRKKAPKSKKDEAVDVPKVQEALEPEPEPAQVPVKKPEPIFKTFKSSQKLPEGLCMLRAIGGGRYEMVGLKDIDQQHFSSQETGSLINADEGRRDLLDLDEKEWEAVKFTCGQAVRSADKSIFRIEKLPLELRLIIYGFAMIGSKPLRHYRDSGKQNSGFAPLMQISKRMLEETRPIFYKNSFHISACEKIPGDHLMAIKPHLREATFTWAAFGRKEINAIKWLATCPSLKVLNLRVTSITSDPSIHHRHQYLFRDVVAIKKFQRCRGFDEIVRQKGLEKVVVVDNGSEFTAAEIKAFQDFLTPLLTTPKYVPPPKPENIVKVLNTKKVRKTKRRTANWEDDTEYAE